MYSKSALIQGVIPQRRGLLKFSIISFGLTSRIALKTDKSGIPFNGLRVVAVTIAVIITHYYIIFQPVSHNETYCNDAEVLPSVRPSVRPSVCPSVRLSVLTCHVLKAKPRATSKSHHWKSHQTPLDISKSKGKRKRGFV